MGNRLDTTLEFINYGRDIRSSPSPSDTHNATVITKQHVEIHRLPITKTTAMGSGNKRGWKDWIDNMGVGGGLIGNRSTAASSWNKSPHHPKQNS